jgi:hypothetical protein
MGIILQLCFADLLSRNSQQVFQVWNEYLKCLLRKRQTIWQIISVKREIIKQKWVSGLSAP